MNKALQVILTVAVVANLVLTAVILQRTSTPKNLFQQNASSHRLPIEIDKKVIALIAESFKEKYNSEDTEVFKTLFSDFAISQMKHEDIKKNYETLHEVFGEIKKTTFSHYEFSGEQGNVEYFVLHFIAELKEETNFGKLGKLRIGISWDGTEYGVISAFLNAETQ